MVKWKEMEQKHTTMEIDTLVCLKIICSMGLEFFILMIGEVVVWQDIHLLCLLVRSQEIQHGTYIRYLIVEARNQRYPYNGFRATPKDNVQVPKYVFV